MDQACSSPDSGLGRLDPDSSELQVRVDFFRKLGYSATDVRHVLTKLGLSTDTNSVLGELVKTSGTSMPLPSHSGDERGMGGHKDPPVAPALVLGHHRRATPPPPLPFQLEDRSDPDTELKPVVIDGSNVAMSHGNKEVFSCRGIQLAVSYFLDRGHTSITVFVPTWRKEQPRPDAPIKDQHILTELERAGKLVFTPSRRVGGKRVVCYDDRFIVKLAYESDGVIVSNDTYRDLQGERPEWKKCIEERLLMYSFVNDKFMPPDDPLGRHGPSLDNFLRKKPLPAEHKKQLCPYDKKCTYGIKCKFYHPERAKQSYRSLADELRESARNCRGDVKEERNLRLMPRGSDSGSSHNPLPYSLEYELGHKLSLEQRIPLHPAKVSENTLLYRDGHGANHTHAPVSATPGSQWQKSEWSAMHSSSDRPYASLSSDHLDSGLGSYESHCSDISHGHCQSYRQQQGSNPRYNHDATPPCRCCSHVPPVANQCCNSAHIDSHSQARYDPYSPHMYPPNIRNAYSLPSQPHHSGSHQNQHKCRSDPFQWLPHPRSGHSLPGPVRSPTPHIPSCYYGEHGHHTWAQPQRPSSAAFGPERLELRKNLLAIFSPQQVDAVMEMFPNQMNAQKLAAEILNMKSHGGIF